MTDRPSAAALCAGRRAPRARAVLSALVVAAAVFMPRAAAGQVRADVSVNTSGGYARIVFRFNEDAEAEVRLAGGILVIGFQQPVEVNVDRLTANGTGYISAARRDPDGRGLRIALARKVAVNSMTAGERLFVDLLPDGWSGPVPSLPQEVVEDLARRAREAEKRERQHRALAQQRARAATRVRVAHQPTFSRYVFELPALLPVATDRGKDKLSLLFDAPLRIDLADAKASLPPMVESIDATPAGDSVTVSFTFNGKVDIRSFREDNNYVVDVVAIKAKESESAAPAFVPPPLAEAAETPSAKPPAEAPEAPAEPPAEQGRAALAIERPQAAQAAAAPALAVPEPPPDTAPAAPVRSPATFDLLAPSERAAPAGANALTVGRRNEPIRLTFSFATPTPAAAFARSDAFWLVFDDGAAIDLSALAAEPVIRQAAVTTAGDAQIVHLKFDRPRLVSLDGGATSWTLDISDAVAEPAQPLTVARIMSTESMASAHIALKNPRRLHRLDDPDIGDTLLVVTALAPARGILKTQDFVEFRALASVHGVVIQPLADDLGIELAGDRVMIGRPGGLALSSSGASGRAGGALRAVMFDTQLWGFDRKADFDSRLRALVSAAAQAPEAKRTSARLDIARLYFARDMYAEAKGVLDVVLNEERPTADDAIALVMHALANALIGRSSEALKELSSPIVGMQNDAQLWRAFASAKQGRWAEAREGFRKTELALAALPIELQRLVRMESVRAAIEVRDFATAADQLAALETLGVPDDLQAPFAVLSGRIYEGLGRTGEALVAYRAAADSSHRPAATQGRLHETSLRFQLGDLKRADVVSDLETLTATWRGDETEIEALQLLARLYTEDERHRDAFSAMRVALRTQPNLGMTRRIQDEAAATFEALFLGGKGDAMPAIDALALFYDFRELTPIGRRGDEMIRRLADRLVSVDLLAQAAELLQHQIDHRLQGAARAQVAARLAAIYLMDRKPDRALAAIRATRISDLPNELRSQRLLLEARAMSDVGRHNLALEVIENIEGQEAVRLRSDILWAAKRWREAAEQIELLYGERWREWRPLNDIERRDILRAGLGFALEEDAIGLARLRDKFGAGMMQSADRRAFEIVTNLSSPREAEFRDIARAIAAVDTLAGFLRDMRHRYPESAASPAPPAAGAPSGRQTRQRDVSTTGALAAPGRGGDLRSIRAPANGWRAREARQEP